MAKTTYVWDELSDNVSEEYEDGVLSASYTHEPGLYGNLLSQNRNGVTSYYHYDGRGDTVALTDDSGNVTDTKEYDAWANVIASTGITVTPHQFQGRVGVYRDSITQLLTRRSGPYLPSIGRWLTLFTPAQRRTRFSSYTFSQPPTATSNDENEPLSIQIETTRVPGAANCGETLDAFWKFSLTEEAPCNGFMIQKVTVTCKIVECACRNKDVFESDEIYPSTDYSYYEAWRVRKHKREPVTFGGVDHFRHTPTTCRRGQYVQSGEVRFYCNADVGLEESSTENSIPNWNRSGQVVFYGPENAHQDCRTSAGRLTSTGAQPKFWDGFGANSKAKLATRRAWVDWICCPKSDNCLDGYGADQGNRMSALAFRL